MKNLKRKLISLVTVCAIAMVTAIPAFAEASSVNAPGYGTLTGVLQAVGYQTVFVDYNNDNAILVMAGSQADRNGNTLVSEPTTYSSRGSTLDTRNWPYIHANAYALYGVHGVQSGTSYGAYATYTYTQA